jgi:hypothetical protein
MGPKTQKIFSEELTLLGEAGIPQSGGIPNKNTAAATPQTNVPGTTVKSKVGGFLNKVGSAYNKLQKGAEQFNKLGKGDLSVLKDLGDKMLAKQLDIDTNKAGLFGTKGFTKLQIVDRDLILKLTKMQEKFSDSVDGLINEMYSDLIFELRKTSKLRRSTTKGKKYVAKKAGNNQPKNIQNENEPETNQTGNDVNTNISGVTVLNFIITKKDSALQNGIPFTLAPADEQTKQILQKNNLSYAKFVKKADSEDETYNNGALYFYDISNNYAPDYTQETINFTYKAPNYIMGNDIQAGVAGNIDNPKLLWFANTPKSNHKVTKLDKQYVKIEPKVDVNKLPPTEQKVFANGPVKAMLVANKAYNAYLQQGIYPVYKNSIEPVAQQQQAPAAKQSKNQAPKQAKQAVAPTGQPVQATK